MKTSLRTNVIAVTRVHCIICKLHEGTAKPQEATLFTWSIMAILIAKIRSGPFSNSSEILSMSLISTSFMKIQQKIMKLRCSKRRLWPFLTINGTQLYHFWSDLAIFELARDFMHIIVIFQVS